MHRRAFARHENVLPDEATRLRQAFDVAIDVDARVLQFARRLARESKRRADAAIDVDHRVALGRAGSIRQRVELFLEFGQILGERLQHGGPLVKGHRPQGRPAHFARIVENGAEVDAGRGCMRDDFAGRGIAHGDAAVAAALPGTGYIALQAHWAPLRKRAQRPRNWASTVPAALVTATS